MIDVGARYNARREEILGRIARGEVSASMSGIEYYPRPWEELNPNNLLEAFIILENSR